MRIAISGKGGSGQTTIAGTLARVYARPGHHVLAIDCHPNPNLAISHSRPTDALTERILADRLKILQREITR